VGTFLAASVLAQGGLFGGTARGRWRLLPCAANGEVGFGLYRRTVDGYEPFGVSVVSLAADEPRVEATMVFIDPGLPIRFGLSERVPDKPSRRRRQLACAVIMVR
jgi:hypothetical protein